MQIDRPTATDLYGMESVTKINPLTPADRDSHEGDET
jgi:hypothetical protein